MERASKGSRQRSRPCKFFVQGRCRSDAFCKFSHESIPVIAHNSPSLATPIEITQDQKEWGAIVYCQSVLGEVTTVQDYHKFHYDHIFRPLPFPETEEERKERQENLYWMFYDHYHANVDAAARMALIKYELTFHDKLDPNKRIPVQRLFPRGISIEEIQIDGELWSELWSVLIEAVKQFDVTFFYILRDKIIGFDQLIGSESYKNRVTGSDLYGKWRTEFLDLLLCHESRWHMIYAMLHDKCFALQRTKYAAAFAVIADRFSKQLISEVSKHCPLDVARLVESH